MPNFPKRERLSSHNEIENLFAQGGRFMAFPFSVRYLVSSAEALGVFVLLSCPKRYQRLAVNRNRTKRILRETYRLNKQKLQSLAIESGKRLLVSICLVSKELPSYSLTEERMKKILDTLSEKLQ